MIEEVYRIVYPDGTVYGDWNMAAHITQHLLTGGGRVGGYRRGHPPGAMVVLIRREVTETEIERCSVEDWRVAAQARSDHAANAKKAKRLRAQAERLLREADEVSK